MRYNRERSSSLVTVNYNYYRYRRAQIMEIALRITFIIRIGAMFVHVVRNCGILLMKAILYF